MPLAARVLLVTVALALALAAGAQWTAQRGLMLGRNALDHRSDIAAAAGVLEHAARLWPARRDAAYERARAALLMRDADAALAWLARCQGRVPSHLRWCQVAANAHAMRGDLAAAETALTTALTLNPAMPARDREALEDLRRRRRAAP